MKTTFIPLSTEKANLYQKISKLLINPDEER